jgi:hypothetical protein
MAVAPLPGPPAPGPYTHGTAITPADGTVFAVPTRGIIIGAAGTLAVLFAGDTVPVTITGLQIGWVHELAVTKVLATGTTATNVIGVW